MILKELRTIKNATQCEIAEALGVQRYTYAKWEQGRAEPSIDDLIKLSNIFGCTVDYLIGNENDFGAITTTSPTLTKTQSELLSVFNLLSEDDQHQVIGFAKALAY